MALIPSRVPLALGALDTKTDSRWAVPGTLDASRNMVFDNFPKLRKRPGYSRLATASAGALVQPFKGQLLLGDGGEAQSYAASGLIDKGVLESLSVAAAPVRRDSFAQSTVDCGYHPLGISVYTWETSAGGSQYSVFDTATGQPIVSGASLGANAVKPKTLVLGNYVVILFYDTALNHLRYVAIPGSAPTLPQAAADFAIDPATTQVFDATAINGTAFVAYANNGASNTITLKTLSAQLVVGAATVPVTTDAFNTCCAIFGDGAQNVWVAYYTGTAVKAFAYDFALANRLLDFTVVDAAPGTVRNITGMAPADQGAATILYETVGSASYNACIHSAQVTLSAAVSGVGVLARSVGLASKPFYHLGRIHFLAAYESALQSTYFLISNGKVVGKLAPSLGGGLTKKSILPEVSWTEEGTYYTVYLQADQLASSDGSVFTQAGVMAGQFDFSQRQTGVELSDNLHLSGGILSMYDGAQVCEHGFHVYPENLTFTAGGAGAFTGSFQAVAVYEWMDAQGLIHQSSPSPAVTVSATSNAYFDYSVSSLRLTSKASPVSVVFYRTLTNGTVFFRVSSITSPNFNDATFDTVSAPLHADTMPDSGAGALSGKAQLVFNPDNILAELPNLAAPAPLHVWRYKNRVALIPAENAYQWVFSKAFVAGVPIEFNDQQLFQSISQDGGPLTCGIEMDDKNVLFTKERIYYVVGDGPAPNGTSPDYGSAPQSIPSGGVGCTNRRSLALMDKGVMFQSAKGIYLLGRDLSVSYIGAPVEAFNDLTITAAKVAPNSRRVIFFTDGGIALVYDHHVDKWTVWTNHDAADAAVFAGLLTYVRPNGALLRETPGQYTDDGAPILIGFTTSDLSFAGLSGFQRVYRFSIRGDYRSAHTLQVSVSYDDSPAALQTETVNAAALLGTGSIADTTIADTDNPGGGAYPSYEFVVKCARQKCSSLRITVQEAQLGPTYGEGLSLSGITFLVGGLKGLHPVAKARAI